MKLVIGGSAQGKLDYVLERYGRENCVVLEGMPKENAAKAELLRKKSARRETPGIMVCSHFHSWVKQRILEGGCPEDEAEAFLVRYPDCIVVSDEIGNGIVPADAFEREWRERTGRLLVRLASRSEEVERIICGIAQRIK